MREHRIITGILTPAEADACAAASADRANPLVRELVHAVAQTTGIPAQLIYGRNRETHVCHARQIVMLAAFERGMSLAAIGRALGRDHTTVAYGVAAEKARRARD
jgi:chromosomal replication initiation ATPase DnaA